MTLHKPLLWTCPLFVLAACHASSSPPPFDWCVANQPPNEACFASKRDPGSANVAQALTLAQRQATLNPDPTTSFTWDWTGAVMMISFVDLYRVNGDEPTFAWVQSWLNGNIAAGYQISESDTAAPVGADVPVGQFTGNMLYQQPITDFWNYINNECLRTPQGGLNHLGTSNVIGVSIWVDSLFMFGQPFVRLTVATGDDTGLNAMGQQLSIFIDQLQDPSGFFHHASPCAFNQDYSVFWGRGNGWVVWAMADYLRERKVRGESDAKVEASLQKLVTAVIGVQDSSGLWWTVINEPGKTYLETSGSALIAAGLARGWRAGVLGDEVLPVISKAMAGLQTQIVPSPNGPVVTNISGPTDPGTFQTYAAVPVENDLPYGIGAVVLALIETSGLPTQ